ncbi:MAG: hypothetical protein KKC84_06600, partial [Candidatus Omnitrophica bacterium]|nr:hypothetical protein [Candidatus Omnitrophota bacterium]
MGIFAGSEIVGIAVEIEKNGRDFYRLVAQNCKRPEAKRIFTMLEGEEEKHIAAFSAILQTMQKYEPAESYPQEYFAYMRALAGDHIFTQKDKGTEVAKAIATD